MTKKASSRQKHKKDDRSLDTRLLAYCAMAGGALAVAAPAGAAVVYSGVKNLTVNSGNPNVPLDLDNNTVIDCRIDFESGGSWKSLSADCLSFSNSILGADFRARNLAKGDAVSPQEAVWMNSAAMAYFWRTSYITSYTTRRSTTSTYNGRTYTNWNTYTYTSLYSASSATGNFSGKKGYLGIRFFIDSVKHYGWIQFQAPIDASSGTIIDWAYETEDNASIVAGDNGSVPATSTTTSIELTTTTTTSIEQTTTTSSIEPVTTTTSLAPTTTTTAPVTACTVTLLPGKISKLFSSIKPVAGFLLRGDEAASFSRETSINWGTDGVKTLFKMPLGKRALFAVVLFKPAVLAAGDTYEVTVGGCTGELSVRPL